MEISRQRRRTGILEGTTHVCPHCAGAGRVRSVESSALAALRAVEMEALRGGGELSLRAPREVALYILNHKREYLTRLLRRNALFVNVVIDEALAHADHDIERISDVPYAIPVEWEEAADPSADALVDDDDVEFDEEDLEAEADDEVLDEFAEADADDEDSEDDEDDRPTQEASGEADGGRRRNRRRRRGRRDEPAPSGQSQAQPRPPERPAETDGESDAGRRRRRGRRGGRRPRDEVRNADAYAWSWPARLSGDDTYEWRGPIDRATPNEAEAETTPPEPVSEPAPAAVSDLAQWLAAPAPATETASDGAEDIWVELAPEPAKPARSRRGRGRTKSETAEPVAEVALTQAADAVIPATESQTVAVDEPAAVDVAIGEAPAAAVSAAPDEPDVAVQAETEAEPAPRPAIAAVVAMDATEITAPPVAPKRGWWRRSV